MEFGWINIFGAAIVILIMIPNIIYAVKHKQTEAEKELPPYLSICEQIGRYGCITTVILLLGYYLFWVKYARNKTLTTAMALAVIPTILFWLSGVLLKHWALVAFAILFGLSHCKITYLTHR